MARRVKPHLERSTEAPGSAPAQPNPEEALIGKEDERAPSFVAYEFTWPVSYRRNEVRDVRIEVEVAIEKALALDVAVSLACRFVSARRRVRCALDEQTEVRLLFAHVLGEIEDYLNPDYRPWHTYHGLGLGRRLLPPVRPARSAAELARRCKVSLQTVRTILRAFSEFRKDPAHGPSVKKHCERNPLLPHLIGGLKASVPQDEAETTLDIQSAQWLAVRAEITARAWRAIRTLPTLTEPDYRGCRTESEARVALAISRGVTRQDVEAIERGTLEDARRLCLALEGRLASLRSQCP